MCSDTDGHIFMCRKGSKGVALPTSGDKYINDSWVLVAAAVGYSSNSSGIKYQTNFLPVSQRDVL